MILSKTKQARHMIPRKSCFEEMFIYVALMKDVFDNIFKIV